MKNIYTHIVCLLVAVSITIISQAQNVLKVQTGATLSCTGGAIITLTDMDFDNDGDFNQVAGQGAFVFNGTANNTISGTSSPLFDKLQLVKTDSGKLTLQQHIRISSAISFGGGILDLNAKNILLAPTASLLGESEASHITGINGGYVQIIHTLAAPSNANPGNLGIGITSASNLGSVIIRRGHQSQKTGSGNGNTIFRYYDIIPVNNTALNARLRFNYLDAELNGLQEMRLSMWASSDNQLWTNLGFSARNTTSNYIEQVGINSFHRFALTETTNPFSLIWEAFNTQCISGKTQITWNTLQEQNTTVFVVRRSIDGITWTNIGSLPAAGNSQFALSYSFTDPQASADAVYYQILHEGPDRRQTYSPVLTSQCEQSESFKVYPNPTQGNCWVNIQSERSHTVSIHVHNAQGALLKKQLVEIQSGINVFELSLANYPKGVYTLMFTWSDGRVKVIKVEKI